MRPSELTPDQQARRAKSLERYDRIYSEVEANDRAEWELYCPERRYEPDGCAIHRETQRRVELEQRHDAEESVG